MKLADRTSRIATSPTMKVTATVDRLRREGIDVIDFGAGEPDLHVHRLRPQLTLMLFALISLPQRSISDWM